jgi:hypothetical protein
MAELNLQAVHDEMVSIAYEAGQMILSANPADLDTGTKLNCKFGPKTPAFLVARCIQNEA